MNSPQIDMSLHSLTWARDNHEQFLLLFLNAAHHQFYNVKLDPTVASSHDLPQFGHNI